MGHQIVGSTIVTVSTNQVSTEVKDEAVILNLNDGIYYGLDMVGVRIWQLIQQPITVDDIIETMVSEFTVDSDVCKEDVVSFLEDMASRALIDIHNEASG